VTGGIQIAILLCVLSALGYAVAAVVQEQLAVTGHRSTPRWLMTAGLTAAGAVLHMVALRYGAVGVVQALGALTLLFALPIAALRARSRVIIRAWRDAEFAVAGLCRGRGRARINGRQGSPSCPDPAAVPDGGSRVGSTPNRSFRPRRRQMVGKMNHEARDGRRP
jgi:hypothetical protein